MPATGEVSTASDTLLRSVAIWASTAAIRARAAATSSRRAPDRTLHQGLSCRFRAVASRRYARDRHVPPRQGVVTLLARSGVGCEQRVEALEIGLRRLELGRGGANVGFGRVELRLRLADLLGPGTRLEQSQLSDRLIAVSLRPPDVQLGVGRAQTCNERPDFDAIALAHLELDDPPANFRRDPHFGGLHVARRPRRRLRTPIAARKHARGRADASQDGHRQFPRESNPHDISIRVIRALRDPRFARSARSASRNRPVLSRSLPHPRLMYALRAGRARRAGRGRPPRHGRASRRRERPSARHGAGCPRRRRTAGRARRCRRGRGAD